MHLLVGLGNPGAEYAGHRHNLGFRVIDAIAGAYGAPAFSKKFHSQFAECRVAGEKVLLLKPQTYMNRSGLSVGEAMRFYKLTPADVTVFYDELDLPTGKVRIKTGGGNGGHNGLKDIDAHIGPDYRRVRFGIGHPGHKDRVTGHVLSNFSKEEWAVAEPVIDELVKQLPLLLKGDDAGVMTRVALKYQELNT
jgi:peptidyl-tRNA hydrolase, PTH1 family